MSTTNPIASHYSSEDALARIDQQLRAQGIDPEHPSLDALAPYDNFHSRGLAATVDLIALAEFPAGARARCRRRVGWQLRRAAAARRSRVGWAASEGRARGA